MKILFLSLICSFTFISYSQTALIAHKSHSGNRESYFIDPNTNFGEVPLPENFRSYYYDSINDTTIIRTISNGYEMQVDTLKNGQLESLEMFRAEDIRIQQRIVDSVQQVKDSLQHKVKQEENMILPVSSPGKGNPPSFLLVLFSVSAVLLVLVRLVVRERKPVPASGILVLLISLISSSVLNAQTPLIAHKSHSGNRESYFIDPNSNFGIDPHMHDLKFFEYTSVNDSLIIRKLKNGREEVFAVDTLMNSDKQSLTEFEQAHYGDLGPYVQELEQKQLLLDSIKRSQDSVFMHQFQVSPMNEKNGLGPIVGQSGKGNPPSFLLVLFSVSAVLMILVRMVVRERKAITV